MSDLPIRERIAEVTCHVRTLDKSRFCAAHRHVVAPTKPYCPDGLSRADAVLAVLADLPDTAVEAGAKALHNPLKYPFFDWGELPEGVRDNYRLRFRAATIAAIKEGKA